MINNPKRPPIPDDEASAARWTHSAMRRRMLSGQWAQDLRQALAREVDPTRLRSWGEGDLTKNIFRSVVRQLSVLYDREPVISHETPEAAAKLSAVLGEAGVWALATRLQMYTLGMREAAYRIAFVKNAAGDPALQFRIVPPDLLIGDAHPDEPDVPTMIAEYRLRYETPGVHGSEVIWTRDVFDIRDPNFPIYRVESADGKADLSATYLGGDMSGENYPYRKADGRPCLPFVLYHAERTNRLFDAFEGIELVEGSLIVAVLWTFWRHCVRDCSWPQRYAVGVRPAGGFTVDDNDRNMAYIPTDPASLLNFEPSGEGGATLGQFAAGIDPQTLGDSIRNYAADLAQDFGMSPSDVTRVAADPRSGYAIALSREGVRHAQRRFEPQFRRGDLDMLETAAAVWNWHTGEALPETGYRIHYPGIPLSDAEKEALIKNWEAQAALGVASPVDLYMAIHGVSRETATAALSRIDQERRQYLTQ